MDTFDLSWFASATAYDLCSLYGFNNGPDSEELGCSRVWSKQDRLLMSNYLRGAKERVEQFLGFPLTPKFICDERVGWNRRGLIGPLRWGYAQKVGVKTEATVETQTELDLSGDIVTVESTVTFTDICEARYFLEDSKGGDEVYPYSKAISSGTLTALFHKCTLVDPSVPIPDGGLDYEDENNFVDTVIVKRIYAAPGTGASLGWSPRTAYCSSCSPCVDTLQTACAGISNKRLSLLRVSPASWDGTAWHGRAFIDCYGSPDFVALDYLAYFDEDCISCEDFPSNIKWAIIHVALADMPRSVCGCNVHSATFVEDSQIADPPAEDNFFGIKVGHVHAQTLLQSFAIGQGGLLSHSAV